MPDGPFNNLKLGRRWNRFAATLDIDAADDSEQRALASDAILNDILTEDFQPLLTDLREYERRPQLDLDPLSSVESIFRSRSKTAFSDTFQKELSSQLGHQMTPDRAIGQALDVSVDYQIRKAKNRIQEECIRLRESREMRREQFDRTVTRANAVFDTLPKGDICNALRAGDKNAFKNAVSKRKGVDEGPSL